MEEVNNHSNDITIAFRVSTPNYIEDSNLNTLVLQVHELRNLINDSLINLDSRVFNCVIDKTIKTLENMKIKEITDDPR